MTLLEKVYPSAALISNLSIFLYLGSTLEVWEGFQRGVRESSRKRTLPHGSTQVGEFLCVSRLSIPTLTIHDPIEQPMVYSHIPESLHHPLSLGLDHPLQIDKLDHLQ